MKIITTAQMRDLEEREISSGTSAESLMEAAGTAMAHLIQREFPACRDTLILAGKGNNGGDGLVIARQLAVAGWPVRVHLAGKRHELGALGAKKLVELEKGFPSLAISPVDQKIIWPRADGVLVDAVLGLGAHGTLRGILPELVTEMNRARGRNFFRTVSVDVPSGLGEETPLHAGAVVVMADLTLAVGYGKDFLFREEAAAWVGRLEIVPIFTEQPRDTAWAEAAVPWELNALLPRRPALSHKNTFGRVLILGGSPGFSGAPLLTARAALAAGAGLVNVGVREEVYESVMNRAPLEAMIFKADEAEVFLKNLAQADVVAIGPGLGLDAKAEIFLDMVLAQTQVPLLIDADALTWLSRNLSVLVNRKHPVVLTPHPGEMRRLLGRDFSVKERPAVAQAFAEQYGVTLILKGTRTLIAGRGQTLYVNTTGNPGLACGGSGDTLLGIVAALLAQGLSPHAAARLAVWWHGRAADVALRERGAEEGMGPADVTQGLAMALKELRAAG